jgi:type 1 glutamine amidotransferase
MAFALFACGDNQTDGSLIVFTRETEWMHTSNPVAAHELQSIAAEHGWHLTVSDDPAVFTEEALAQTRVVVFSLANGRILDDASRVNLEKFFRSGGGFVGIHSASYAEFDWPFYKQVLVPVSFKTHPAPVNGAPTNVLPGTLEILAPDDPIMAGIPNPWVRSDEFYTFWERPEDIAGLHLLNALDEDSMGSEYPAEVRVGFHPLTFTHENEGTRVFYTALGHTDESYSEPAFMRMISQAIDWAGRR